MRVVAQVLLLDRDARELLLALEDVVERGAIDGGADRHVRVRRLGDALDHALVDRAGGRRSRSRAAGRGGGARSRRPGPAGSAPAPRWLTARSGCGARGAAGGWRRGGARGCRARASAAGRPRRAARSRRRRGLAVLGGQLELGSGSALGRSWTTAAWRVLTSSLPCGRRCCRAAPRCAPCGRGSRAPGDVVSPDSTCRNQRRKNSAANSTNAMPPKMATRRASCGDIVGRRSSSCGGIRLGERGRPPVVYARRRRRRGSSGT